MEGHNNKYISTIEKRYIRPETEIMELRMSGVLCVSGDIDGNANHDALAPGLFDNWYSTDEEYEE